jgi:molybdenum ABC transporter molybdate-binding protein
MHKFITVSLAWLIVLVHSIFGSQAFAHQKTTVESVEEAPLTIAVASNFKYTLEQLIARSPFWSTQDVRIVTGSSGVLYAQILKGAPFDVFLSADTERPNKLVQTGLGHHAQVYAIGRLALWTGHEIGVSEDAKINAKPSYLSYLSEFSGKLAVADPRVAPFGKAALEVIENEPALRYLKTQLVKGTNVNQAFQFVDSGNAQAGLIAESLLIQARAVLGSVKYEHYMLIPRTQYTRIEQAIISLKSENTHSQSDAFVRFILSPETQTLLTEYGYDRP